MAYLFLALVLIAFILLFVGQIMFIIAAFRTSVVWGLCVLLLGPASLLFLFMHWEEAKKPFQVQILGALVAIFAIFSGFGDSASGLEGFAKKIEESGLADKQMAALQKIAEEKMDEVSVIPLIDQEAETAGPSLKDPASFEGVTLQKTREILGRPKGEMQSGHEICWLYETFSVFSADGQTVSHVETGDGDKRVPKKRATTTTGRAADERAVRIIANGGNRIDMKQVLVPGKITVVDFYADWCGPCRRMGPQLEQIARSEPDVTLCKIDIVNWKTPVVKQFGIRSIPHVRVYSHNGAAVGNPTSSLDAIKHNITRAR